MVTGELVIFGTVSKVGEVVERERKDRDGRVTGTYQTQLVHVQTASATFETTGTPVTVQRGQAVAWVVECSVGFQNTLRVRRAGDWSPEDASASMRLVFGGQKS